MRHEIRSTEGEKKPQSGLERSVFVVQVVVRGGRGVRATPQGNYRRTPTLAAQLP